MKRVVVVGGGVGGLAAAARLARSGFTVTLLEARDRLGGLAGGFELEGLPFDAGPYVLLDRPGLEFAFTELGLELGEHVELRRVTDFYDVERPGEPPVHVVADLDATAAGIERYWPGGGAHYARFVNQVARIYHALQPLQRVRPSLLAMLRTGAIWRVPFLLRSLASVLRSAKLPQAVIDAASIWSHVAGHRPEDAPSPLAFVPAVVHTVGAFYPSDGIGAVPRALIRPDVEYRQGEKVARIERGCVVTERGEVLAADAIVSDAAGLSTYLELLHEPPPDAEQLRRLPLQSPGVCAYLAVRRGDAPPYLRFHLPGGDNLVRLLIQPAVMRPELLANEWRPARLLAPMRHEDASRGVSAQRDYLAKILDEPWWKRHVGEYRVLATRLPAEWGRDFHLYRDSMNPVMTPAFMRAGRMAHRSPHVRGLYLAGSATHPGQWVSFCAISGVLAAKCVEEDFLRNRIAAKRRHRC